MWKRRRSPAPFFRQGSPYDAMAGAHAPIGVPGLISRVGMMQIVGDDETEENADTHANYVICRGYDPESRKFYHRIKVGKPYGTRGTYPYGLAEVYPAMMARTRMKDTPGMAETTVGQPEDLDENMMILRDEDGNPIWWILLDSAPQARLAMTVPDPYTGVYPCNPSNTFWIVFVEASFPKDQDGMLDWTISAHQAEASATTTAMGIGLDSYVPIYTLLTVNKIGNQWWFQKPVQGLTRFRLEENHPGRGDEFEVSIGTPAPGISWDYETNAWLFSADTHVAIDWHNDGPYPNKGAQGYGQWEVTDVLDEIPTTKPDVLLHSVSMDCVAPAYSEQHCED